MKAGLRACELAKRSSGRRTTPTSGELVMTGLLIVAGTVDASQFWPSGDSDADTVKLAITKPQTAFQFRSSPGAKPQVTHAFDKAGMFETVKGKRKFKSL